MRHEVLILGGGYAGLLTALRLSRRLRGRARITLISASEIFAERIRQHQVAAGAALRQHSLPRLLAGSGVRFVPARVDAIDLERGELRAGHRRLGFEELVLALGSQVDVTRVPGAREHALTLDAAQAPLLRERLASAARDGSRVAVCGGGLSGIELSAELCERWPGLPLTLLTAGELGPGLSLRARAYIRHFFAQRGVQVREAVRVEGIEPGGVWLREEVEGSAWSQRVTSELTVWAGGFVGSELPRSAGLAVNLREQVRVDPALRSLSHRNVTVVGDAAALEGRSAPLQLSCKVALPMAITGADNLARRLAGIPEQAFEFQDAAVCISLGRRAGVVDLRHPDASVRERIISGRWGAWLKESVCRFTVRRMHWERGAFWPPGSLRAPARLEADEERPQIAS
jgi:NADH:ubiquinone reductase (H+-translocating)